MSVRSANRLWIAWSVTLLLALAGAFWASAGATLSFDSQESLAPLRSGIEDLEAVKARFEAISTRLESNADELSRIAQRQLPRPPFGLVEPPFVQDMREREDGLLSALNGIGEQLRESKQELIELQQQVNIVESSMQSDVDEIGLLKEKSDAKRFFSSFALVVLGVVAALSIFVLAWRMDGRSSPVGQGEENA